MSTSTDGGFHRARGVPTSAVEIAQAIAVGRCSATRVIEETFEQIDALNPTLNALVTLRRSEAIAEARLIDARIRAGSTMGPLAGVPFTVKDVVATAGLPSTCGSLTVHGRRTDPDAAAVAAMRRAGAILVGKSNCSEFALSIHTDNRRYGATQNPLGDYTSGGSSGGEAAALAAGMSAVGLGTDFGGSARWPAQCTGIVGLRPTVGRVPASGQVPRPSNPDTFQGRLQVIGPMARTVPDVEATLRVVAGTELFGRTEVDQRFIDSSAVRLDGVECRWGTSIGPLCVSGEIADAIAGAAVSLGVHCGSMAEGLPGALTFAHDVYTSLRATDPLSGIRALTSGHEHELTASTREALALARPDTDAYVAMLWAERDRLRNDLFTWLRGDRILLLPVSVITPFTIRTPLPIFDGRQLTEAEIVAPSRLVSLFGIPSISVPCGIAVSGAPVSAQLVAPPFREDLLLAAAQQLFDSMPR